MSEIRPSDEILSAFVDGEFSPEDRLFTLKTIAADEGLSREVCDLYQLKELVAMAYREDAVPTADPARCRTGGTGWMTAVAAGAGVLALGLAALIGVDRMPVSEQRLADSAAGADSARVIGTIPREANQVLLHVTDAGRDDALVLFDDIEHMFQTALLDGQDLKVQMVVHGNALEFVRADLTPFPHRIRDLVETYPGLRITACAQSRARAERVEGYPVEFLPWVDEVPSGVHEAARRQAEGWTYIRL